MAKPKILVAHDLRAGGASAFDAAVALARDLGADLVLAHAFRARYMSQADVIHVSLSNLRDLEAMVELADAHELTESWANKARAEGLAVSTDVGEGDPSKFLLAAAERHDALMIVIGGGGARGLRRLVHASAAAGLLRHSRRPVLIAPPARAGASRPDRPSRAGTQPPPKAATAAATPKGKSMTRTQR